MFNNKTDCIKVSAETKTVTLVLLGYDMYSLMDTISKGILSVSSVLKMETSSFPKNIRIYL
jgi:hypothetical protein